MTQIKKPFFIFLLITFTVISSRGAENFSLDEERADMVESQIIARGIKDKATINAMRSTKRHLFVPESEIDYAYRDGPLPIGYGQTISQPFIVAYMTEQLKLQSGDTVLEIGTGSGYQAAVLSEIVDQVYSVEIIKELGADAEQRFKELEYDNVHIKIGDGYFGWKEHSPYSAIIVTAAAGYIPKPLIEQLADGGRMIIPVGDKFMVQYLVLITKEGDKVTTTRLIPVRFVPFTREK